MSDIHQDKILILDFGSQYTQLIGRRVRELGVYCEERLPRRKNANLVMRLLRFYKRMRCLRWVSIMFG